MSVTDRARLFEAGVKKPAAGKAASVPAYGGKSIKERLKMFESLSIPESGVEQLVLLIRICKVFSPDDSAMRSLLRSASVKMKMCDSLIHDKKKQKAAKTNIFSQLVHSTSFDDAKSMLDTIDVEWFFNFR